jgi:GPI mannosyltransferase 3
MIDRWFYGIWTLPAAQFVRLNVSQGLAAFYGRNRIDYYFTEGFPLLLTTSLPFTVYGVGQQLFQNTAGQNKAGSSRSTALWILSLTILFIAVTLSVISHKEVRFLYPTLPALHILAAKPLAGFWESKSRFSRVAVPFLILCNIVLAVYTSQVHQRGVIDVTDYLRHKHEARIANDGSPSKTSVGILMPCHSTPWRSHLVHKGIDIWALTCEPPLNVPMNARANYLDEADQFYDDPESWLAENMADLNGFQPKKKGAIQRRQWPENIVFFEQLEPAIKRSLGRTRYHECWRTFNSHWHDDWRRKGDVIVWCAA